MQGTLIHSRELSYLSVNTVYVSVIPARQLEVADMQRAIIDKACCCQKKWTANGEHPLLCDRICLSQYVLLGTLLEQHGSTV